MKQEQLTKKIVENLSITDQYNLWDNLTPADKDYMMYSPTPLGYNTISEQAFEYLTRIGFNVVSRASEFENYIFFCDNWGKEFIDLK